MGKNLDQQCLIAELSHQINNPLAAIRNALYLASCQTDDQRLLSYLALADEEITAIAGILRDRRDGMEKMQESAEPRVALLSMRRAAA